MQAKIFLPSARSAPESPLMSAPALLARECARILDRPSTQGEQGIQVARTGVIVEGDELDAMRLNLHSRLAQRVLWPLAHGEYASEDDLYRLARRVTWSPWITPQQTLRVDTTAQRSPLRSLNFATLRIKDAVCDDLREATGERPSVDTRNPDLSLALHLSDRHATLYADTSGDGLFKRGWRSSKEADGEVHGEAPLKETLAAQMIAASGWQPGAPLLDPCCGAGTIAIEAAQIACNHAPGLLRRFAFERLRPWREHLSAWHAMRQHARAAITAPTACIVASDISHKLVGLAKANAKRAGVAHAIEFAQSP